MHPAGGRPGTTGAGNVELPPLGKSAGLPPPSTSDAQPPSTGEDSIEANPI